MFFKWKKTKSSQHCFKSLAVWYPMKKVKSCSVMTLQMLFKLLNLKCFRGNSPVTLLNATNYRQENWQHPMLFTILRLVGNYRDALHFICTLYICHIDTTGCHFTTDLADWLSCFLTSANLRDGKVLFTIRCSLWNHSFPVFHLFFASE